MILLRAILYTMHYTTTLTALFVSWCIIGHVADQHGLPILWVAITAAMIASIAVTYAYPQAARDEDKKKSR